MAKVNKIAEAILLIELPVPTGAWQLNQGKRLNDWRLRSHGAADGGQRRLACGTSSQFSSPNHTMTATKNPACSLPRTLMRQTWLSHHCPTLPRR